MIHQDAQGESEWWDAKEGDPFEVWAEPIASNEEWDKRAEDCLDLIIPELDPALDRLHAKALDLGCGVGRLTIPAAKQDPEVSFVGLDIAESMIVEARVRKRQAKQDLPNLRFVRGDGRTLNGAGPFNAGWSMLTFQHLPYDAQAGYLLEVAKRMPKGGLFRFQTVKGDEDVFMSHQVHEIQVLGWCAEAHLEVLRVDHGGIYPNWMWTTVSK